MSLTRRGLFKGLAALLAGGGAAPAAAALPPGFSWFRIGDGYTRDIGATGTPDMFVRMAQLEVARDKRAPPSGRWKSLRMANIIERRINGPIHWLQLQR